MHVRWLGIALLLSIGQVADARQGGKGLKVSVLQGDVTAVRADAIVAPINSGGMWFGGIDRAISHRSPLYHQQAANRLQTKGLKHLDAFVVRRQRPHSGSFKDVVFVTDDLKGPVKEVVLKGLEEAHAAGHRSVSIPAIRMGVMRGAVESDSQTLIGLAEGVRLFELKHGHKTSLREINFVVYQDPSTAGKLEQHLQLSGAR